MIPWQERVVAEKAELDAKLEKLESFCGTEEFASLDPVDQELLLDQTLFMSDYSATLTRRIARFKKKGESNG